MLILINLHLLFEFLQLLPESYYLLLLALGVHHYGSLGFRNYRAWLTYLPYLSSQPSLAHRLCRQHVSDASLALSSEPSPSEMQSGLARPARCPS